MSEPFTLTLDDRQLRATLARLAGGIANPAPAMEDIGRALANLAEDAFQAERSPFGQPWEPLTEAYVARPRRQGGRGGDAHPILQRTGRLAGSITHGGDRGGAWVGVSAIYAAIHQFGGDVEHGARTATLYFRQGRDGTVGNRFVRRGRSNFAQDVQIGAHTTTIPARPYLPVNADGELAQAAHAEMLDILADYLRDLA